MIARSIGAGKLESAFFTPRTDWLTRNGRDDLKNKYWGESGSSVNAKWTDQNIKKFLAELDKWSDVRTSALYQRMRRNGSYDKWYEYFHELKGINMRKRFKRKSAR